MGYFKNPRVKSLKKIKVMKTNNNKTYTEISRNVGIPYATLFKVAMEKVHKLEKEIENEKTKFSELNAKVLTLGNGNTIKVSTYNNMVKENTKGKEEVRKLVEKIAALRLKCDKYKKDVEALKEQIGLLSKCKHDSEEKKYRAIKIPFIGKMFA